MRTFISPQRRWIIMGVGIVILLAGTFMFKESAWHTLRQLMATTASPTKQTAEPIAGMSGMDNMAEMAQMETPPMEPSIEMGPSQAYAMVTPAGRQLIGVKTAVVGAHPLQTVIRAVGRIEYDEQRLAHVNLRISGWIEDLFVDYTGQSVRKGQPLFTLYSQELVATQEEYLLALNTKDQIRDSPLLDVREQATQMVEAARDRLRLWTLTEEQIEEVARRGKPQTYVTIYSPVTGYVVEKNVFKGMFVKPEMTLYAIADLSTVWVQAEVFEYEMPFVQVGQPATLTLDAYRGKEFHGEVAYIYPYLNKKARTMKVRLEFPNPTMQLKPDMYGTVRLEVDHGESLAVPEEAVVDSGLRKVVFVVRGEGLFEPREVTLGPKMGRYYEVVEGLARGEHIVTSGTFLLDSESKLMASTNMMGALGMGGIKMEQAQMGEMEMGGMDMGMGKGMEMKDQEMAAARKAPAGMPAGLMEKKTGGLTLVFSTDPTAARMGENRVQVMVTDKNGKPVANAKVQLTFTMPMPGMIPATVPMMAGKPGVYEAKVNLGMAGQWDLTMIIQRSGQPDVKETFSVIAGGGMSGMPGM